MRGGRMRNDIWLSDVDRELLRVRFSNISLLLSQSDLSACGRMQYVTKLSESKLLIVG